MTTLADLFRARYLAAGVDFASVRLHCAGLPGDDTDRACRALRARAFTTGQDIYFAAGAFRPDTRDGRWLLAHEVAHVVQQAAGRAAPGSGPVAPGASRNAQPLTSRIGSTTDSPTTSSSPFRARTVTVRLAQGQPSDTYR